VTIVLNSDAENRLYLTKLQWHWNLDITGFRISTCPIKTAHTSLEKEITDALNNMLLW